MGAAFAEGSGFGTDVAVSEPLICKLITLDEDCYSETVEYRQGKPRKNVSKEAFIVSWMLIWVF